MSLRDRQRAYYYEAVDRLLPGTRARYEKRFGDRYGASAKHAPDLERLFNGLCARYGIATRMKRCQPEKKAEQLQLWNHFS
jgi:hypothetical protein